MRLIDADIFKQQIAAVTVRNNLTVEKCNAMCNLIDNQPTAYDTDKIMERLKAEYLTARCKNAETCDYPGKIGCCYDRAIKRAIEIVRMQCC